jgi:hypothetical protein
VRTSRRLHVRLTAEQANALRSLAAGRGLGLSATVRELIVGASAKQESSEGLPALASLVAAEQAVLMLRDFMPDGSLRSAQAREQAVLAAEWRLAELRESHAGGER